MNQTNSQKKIDTILVPQGTEYQAVCRGLRNKSVQVFPIPIGGKALKPYLNRWQQTIEFLNKPPRGILVMGLGGSLSPEYRIGEIVLYQSCGDGEGWQNCDARLIKDLEAQLTGRVRLVKGITSDRVICSAREKEQLQKKFQVEVVDMEGFEILESFKRLNIPVGIIRVISDDCQQDLPDLTEAFAENGQIKPRILASKMLRQPLAAINLIGSSLKALKKLQEVTEEIF